MAKFHFPLQTALNWRRLEADREEQRLQTLLAQRATLDREEQDWRLRATEAEQTIARAGAISVLELSALDGFLRAVDRACRQIAQKRAVLDTHLTEQRRLLIEAERRVSVIDKLRQRRHTEWQNEADRADAATADELALLRLSREKRAQIFR